MIKMIAIGRLGKDCDVNNVNGKQVLNFSVAIPEKIKGEERTKWVNCAWFTDSQNVAKYLTKGQTVYVEGNPTAKYYTTKDGKTGSNLELFCFSVQLIGSVNKSQPQAPNERTGVNREVDDLPF